MKIESNRNFNVLLCIVVFLILLASSAAAEVIKEGDKTFLVDQAGERWDISQAVSIGYDPYQFEFGIGRHAFRTLDDRHWNSTADLPSSFRAMRVIGVAGDGDAHAYSVGKLRYHEIANTYLGSQAIVTGY